MSSSEHFILVLLSFLLPRPVFSPPHSTARAQADTHTCVTCVHEQTYTHHLRILARGTAVPYMPGICEMGDN